MRILLLLTNLSRVMPVPQYRRSKAQLIRLHARQYTKARPWVEKTQEWIVPRFDARRVYPDEAGGFR